MRVRANLSGHPVDLQMLARLFPSGVVRVIEDGKEFFLEFEAPDSLSSQVPFELHEIIDGIFTRVSGIAWYCDASFMPTALGDQVQTPSGSYTVFRGAWSPLHDARYAEPDLAAGRGTAHLLTVLVDGTISGHTLPGPRMLSLVACQPMLDELLAQLGAAVRRGGPTWGDLYRAHEIIRDEIGGKVRLLQDLGFAAADVGRFTRTANRYRHGRPKGAKAEDPLSKLEGEQFIRDLIDAWIARLGL